MVHPPNGLFSRKSHGSCIVPVHKAWKSLHMAVEHTVLLQILVVTVSFGVGGVFEQLNRLLQRQEISVKCFRFTGILLWEHCLCTVY